MKDSKQMNLIKEALGELYLSAFNHGLNHHPMDHEATDTHEMDKEWNLYREACSIEILNLIEETIEEKNKDISWLKSKNNQLILRLEKINFG